MSDVKSFSRRSFLKMAALSTAGTLLAACAPAAAPTSAVEATKAPAPAEKVSLVLWSHNNPSFVGVNEKLVAKFMEQNPNVTVAYENFPYDDFITKIQTSMAAKNEADVMEMFGSWVQSYAKGGTLAAVDEGMITLGKARDLFYAAPLDGYVWEGKLYGMPNEYNLENGAVLINKRMFEEAGITFPPKWGSWDELVADAKKMVKMDGTTMTVAGLRFRHQRWAGLPLLGGDSREGRRLLCQR